MRRSAGWCVDEERPDISIEPVPERPVAATPLEEFDESIDDEVVADETANGWEE